MDLGKLAQDTLGQMLGGSDKKTTSSPKKTAKKKQSSPNDILSGVEDSVDAAIKNKLPKGAATDIATSMLDQNKDGRIVDDLLRMGEGFLKKKK